MIDKISYKRHKQSIRALILFVSLFFLFSCGIPNFIYLNDSVVSGSSYYTFDSIPDTTNITYEAYNTTFDFLISDSSYNLVDSPSLCYFYSISLVNSDNDTSIINAFNNKYCNYPNSIRLDTSQTDDDPYVISRDLSNQTIKLYKFKYQEGSSTEPEDQLPLRYLSTLSTYTANSNFSNIFNIYYNTDDKLFYFYENGSSIYLTNGSQTSTTNQVALYRFGDNGTFKNSSDEITTADLDYIVNSDGSINSTDTYKVTVYVAMSIEGDFSNIFWSKLQKVGDFSLN